MNKAIKGEMLSCAVPLMKPVKNRQCVPWMIFLRAETVMVSLSL